jgi:hypothetical protein
VKIIDKAAWHIDGCIVPKELIVKHFQTIFLWLEQHEMLTDEGKEELNDGIDDCASLNEDLITPEALTFLEQNYDQYLKALDGGKYGNDFNAAELEKMYVAWKKKI